jgi:hypothetical protein
MNTEGADGSTPKSDARRMVAALLVVNNNNKKKNTTTTESRTAAEAELPARNHLNLPCGLRIIRVKTNLSAEPGEVTG